jgi:hypothetical protein
MKVQFLLGTHFASLSVNYFNRLSVNSMENKQNQTQLQSIPYIGLSIAEDLHNIGVNCVEDLKGKNPEKLYELSNRHERKIQDRCLLYTYRYAVYYAKGGKDKEKLTWWAWKDKKKD